MDAEGRGDVSSPGLPQSLIPLSLDICDKCLEQSKPGTGENDRLSNPGSWHKAKTLEESHQYSWHTPVF